MSCGADTCTNLQVPKIDGKCYFCPDYTRRVENFYDPRYNQEGEDARRIDNNIDGINLDGVINNGDNNMLVDNNSFVNGNRVNRAGCLADTCSPNQILRKDGTCFACLEYTRKQDQRTCSPDPCNSNSIVTIDGTCLQCPLY